jgi:AraC-like DNA-binding protein
MKLRNQPESARTVTPILLQVWLIFGLMRGLSHEELCVASGFCPDDISDRDRMVPRAWYVALRRAVIERLPHVDVGIEIGKLMSLGQFGHLGLALERCQTLGEGLRAALRYVNFVLGPVNDTLPHIEEARDTVDWVIPLSIDFSPEGIEAHFIHIILSIRAIGKTGMIPRRVCFAYPREHLRQQLQVIFASPIEFGCADSRISFERTDFDRPNPAADAEAFRHLEAELDRRIRCSGEPFVALVTSVIEHQISSCDVSQAATAKRLGMGIRTLQRKLTEHAVSYHSLVSQTRRTLGERLLRDPTIAIYRVAFALGYSDVGGFNRAWKQWTGLSPRAFRNQTSARHSSLPAVTEHDRSGDESSA